MPSVGDMSRHDYQKKYFIFISLHVARRESQQCKLCNHNPVFNSPEECKQLMVNLDELAFVTLRVLGHGTLPICASWASLHLWYNDDLNLADNIQFSSVLSYCNFGQWHGFELQGGYLNKGFNNNKIS